MERLRGNARVIEWITANTNMERFVAKYNQHRNSSNPERTEKMMRTCLTTSRTAWRHGMAEQFSNKG